MPTISDTWDDPFETQLKDGTFISNGDNIIRSTRRATEERLGREHDLDPDDQSNHGRHPQHAARIFPATSSTRPDGESLDSDDAGRIALISGVLRFWTGSGWDPIKSRYQGNLRIMTSTPGDPGPRLDSVAQWLADQLWANGHIQPITIAGTGPGGGISAVKGGYIAQVSSGEFSVKALYPQPAGGDVIEWSPIPRSFDTSSLTYWYNLFPIGGTHPSAVVSIEG